MSYNLLELDEMTPRAFADLPRVNAGDLIAYRDAGGTGTVAYPTWTGELPNRFFVARYRGVVLIGELGLYRIGDLQEMLALRDGVTLEDLGKPVH